VLVVFDEIIPHLERTNERCVIDSRYTSTAGVVFPKFSTTSIFLRKMAQFPQLRPTHSTITVVFLRLIIQQK
jgi:hypothetical protein